MDNKKYNEKGYTGLINLGNSCFLNSCIQLLNNTYELYKLLDENSIDRYIKNNNDSIILNEYNELRKTMFNTNGIVSPNRFIHYIQEVSKKKNMEIFSGFNQNDMPEFLLFIVDCMHNAISRPAKTVISGNPNNSIDKKALICYNFLKQVYEKEYSEIMNLFYGISVCEIKSMNEKIYVYRPEHFFILDLPIEHDDIYKCLESFTNYEILDGDNKYYNEKSKKKEIVKKRTIFWSFPEILIITLKRFSYDGSEKNNKMVHFPLTNLDLSKYIEGYRVNNYIYDLYGICNHMGNMNRGHYTCYIKKSDCWIDINDENICKINEKNLITPMSYCLFYRKKKTNDNINVR